MGPLVHFRLDHLTDALMARLEGEVSSFRADILADPISRELLARHLLFAKWTDLLAEDGQFMAPIDAAYHGYYWFFKLQKRLEAQFGQDVGVEQQAFQLLERMPSETDWNRVAEIEALVHSEEASDPNPPSGSGV